MGSAVVQIKGKRTSLFSLMLFLFGVISSIDATITITETGEHFDSRPDSNIGKQLAKGFEYMSRIQYIGNQLCNPSKTSPMWNVIVPEDGVPATLLVFAGGCTTEEKVQNAALYLQPSGVVKYLIVAGDDRVTLRESDNRRNKKNTFDQVSYFNLMGTDLVVLHTSINSGYGLLQTLNKATSETLKAGGPRIMLDSRVRRRGLPGEAAGWLTVCFLLGACSCCFMVAIRIQTGSFFPEDETPPARPRHVLQRLSSAQVDTMYPIYEYNGSQLVHTRGSAHRHSIPPTPVEFSMCSICLDDYLPCDKIRCLQPCNHAFHSTCIAKWLTERSACCPLCKVDLYVEEEEEEEDDDDASIIDEPEVREAITQTDGAPSVAWWRLFFGGQPIEEMPLGETSLQQPLLLRETADSLIDDSERISWWRRLFPGRGSERQAGLETTAYPAPPIENIPSNNQSVQGAIDMEQPLQGSSSNEGIHRNLPTVSTVVARDVTEMA